MGVLKRLTVNGVSYEVKPVVPASYVTLRASGWVGSEGSYSQVVPLVGVTNHTKVDLQPTPEQVEVFLAKTLAFTSENNNGVVTVYSVGDKPEDDYTIQVTLIEAEGSPPIRGNTVGLPNPQADWNQTDTKKADYIKNKPTGDIANAKAHLGNKSNPHGVTAEQVGAAPSGYGLGASGTWVDDLNSADQCGYYSWTSTALNTPFDYGNMFVIRRGDSRVTQIGIDPYMVGHGGIVLRHYTGSRWLEWEWVNPPMVLGVEYRTIERSGGSPVYVKKISLGALPNTGTIQCSVPSATTVVDLVGYSISASGAHYPFPLIDPTSGVTRAMIRKNSNTVVVLSFNDCSAYTGYATIKYTKD